MDQWPLTAEQQHAVDTYLEGGNLLVEAGAGAGKTATLVAMAKASMERRGVYLAFNRALVNDAKRRLPRNAEAATVHSKANRAVRMTHPRVMERLNQTGRLSRFTEARMIGVDSVTVTTPYGRKTFASGWMAGYVMRGIERFCQSDDPEPEAKHLPTIDALDPHGEFGHRGPNNWQLANDHVPALRRAWADLTSASGGLRFKHEHYLKMWELSGPRIPVDFLLLDEAQDLSPVMRSIVMAQREHGTQLIFVGDPQQAIYGFTGAQDAMKYLAEADHGASRVTLTQSFRFGPVIADAANEVLDLIAESDLRIRGNDRLDSSIGRISDPDCILSRTNAMAVAEALKRMEAGQRVSIADALKNSVILFAKAAEELQETGQTWHVELAPFESWDAVKQFVEEDIAGAELALLVKLVDEFGAETIINDLSQTVSEDQADIVLSTAHTSKGREWPLVRLASDFGDGDDEDDGPVMPFDLDVDELRLLYVAVTRAKMRLDCTSVPWIGDGE